MPAGEILQHGGERGLLMPEIRMRGAHRRQRCRTSARAMLKRPPHILVTTPESLYILLTAEKSRSILHDVETVIVDEIHAVADDKRGAHLAISLERLEALTHEAARTHRTFSTQKPIETVAHFLTGSGRPDSGDREHRPQAATRISASEVPPSPLGPVASNEMWDEIFARIIELVEQHRSTLVFVNTRRMAERIAHQLGERHRRRQRRGAPWQASRASCAWRRNRS